MEAPVSAHDVLDNCARVNGDGLLVLLPSIEKKFKKCRRQRAQKRPFFFPFFFFFRSCLPIAFFVCVRCLLESESERARH
jgi:hypothetical protein